MFRPGTEDRVSPGEAYAVFGPRLAPGLESRLTAGSPQNIHSVSLATQNTSLRTDTPTGTRQTPATPSTCPLAELAALRAQVAALEAQLAALQNTCPRAASGPLSLLQTIGDEIATLQNDSDWAGSPFYTINQLKPDHSGKVGELFVKRLCDSLEVACDYNEDINDQDDGTYDVVLNGKRVEIKTARLGKQKGFQHESLRADGCDYYLFLDITPDCFYITVCEKFDMTKQHPVLGRKPHLRKGTSDVYKLDFSEANLQKGIRHRITLQVTPDVTMEQVVEFLTLQIA